MRSTITIEDNLFEEAASICGNQNISTVVTVALKEYVRRAAAQRLIALGGTAPSLSVPNKLRYESTDSDTVPLAAEAATEYNA